MNMKIYIGTGEPWDIREGVGSITVNKLTWKSWEGSVCDFYRSCFYRKPLLQIVVHLIELPIPPVDIVDAAIFAENLQNV